LALYQPIPPSFISAKFILWPPTLETRHSYLFAEYFPLA
jgi:hypothetical protein